MGIAGKWGYSEGGEHYSGSFDSPAEAAAEGFAVTESDSLEIGQYRAPERLEIDSCNALEWAENGLCEEGYGSERDNRPDVTSEMRAELDAELTNVLHRWEERHRLVPQWVIVDDETVRVVTREDREVQPTAAWNSLGSQLLSMNMCDPFAEFLKTIGVSYDEAVLCVRGGDSVAAVRVDRDSKDRRCVKIDGIDVSEQYPAILPAIPAGV